MLARPETSTRCRVQNSIRSRRMVAVIRKADDAPISGYPSLKLIFVT